MTVTVKQYTDLIPSQHRQEGFIKLVEALILPFVNLQNHIDTMLYEFDVDRARGQVLDHIGQWVGIPRNVPFELTDVYFEWGGDGSLGWGRGSWKGFGDPDTGISVLPDDGYRTLIKAKIGANNWDGTNQQIALIYNGIFYNNAQVIPTDNFNMTMDLTIVGGPLTAVEEGLIRTGVLPLRPAAVLTRYFVGPSGGKVFAWNIQNQYFDGWQQAEWAAQYSPIII